MADICVPLSFCMREQVYSNQLDFGKSYGQIFGTSVHCGHPLTLKLLEFDTQQIIDRSLTSLENNMRPLPNSEEENIDPIMYSCHNCDTTMGMKQPNTSFYEIPFPTPLIDPVDNIGCSFFSN
jgi:hypothetical protein